MKFKDLFFTNEGESEKKEVKETKTFKSNFEPMSENVDYSKTATTFPKKTIDVSPTNPSCEPHLEKIMALYEQGFDGLNLDGYDFYEYYKAVSKSGIDNSAMYDMAFTMAKAMDSSVTKTTLLKQSDYYLDEITKVHKHYDESGQAKSNETLNSKNSEEQALTKELSDIDSQIYSLQQLKKSKEGELREIDNKYSPIITEIKCKLMANDIARDTIVKSILKVVNGVKQNIN